MGGETEKKPAEGVDKLGRKVWDKEFYAQKAKERTEKEQLNADLEDDLNKLLHGKKKKLKEAPPPEERTWLTHHDRDLKLDEKLGKSAIITAHTHKSKQGGYWCEDCECLIKDSSSWLDHINGKKHNRIAGRKMLVERVDADKVRERLDALKNRRPEEETREDIEERLASIRQEEEDRKRRKKEKKEKKRKRERDHDDDGESKRPRATDGIDGVVVGENGDSAKAADPAGGEGGEGVEGREGGEQENAEVEEEDETMAMMRAMGLPVGFTAK
eukprot:GDKH01010641.1.p1 GENE.GDKH01010641.1~~GDKH01010641.1.p1  ORF type:complete len:272 (-),score=60.20 GDKH01010641.1:76-891(-)